jgi:hypothetical protein
MACNTLPIKKNDSFVVWVVLVWKHCICCTDSSKSSPVKSGLVKWRKICTNRTLKFVNSPVTVVIILLLGIIVFNL